MKLVKYLKMRGEIKLRIPSPDVTLMACRIRLKLNSRLVHVLPFQFVLNTKFDQFDLLYSMNELIV